MTPLPPPPPPPRRKESSLSELAQALTVSHRPESDPPITQEIDRAIGRAQRKAAIRLWRKARAQAAIRTLVTLALGSGATWLSMRWHGVVAWLAAHFR